MNYRFKKGFTLLELLVVVAVIGFLSSVSIVALSVSQANGRDTTRKLDQVSIIKASELYITDFGAPPTQLEPTARAIEQRFVQASFTDRLFSPLFSVDIANAQVDIMECPDCYNGIVGVGCVYDLAYCSGGGGGGPGTPVCGNGLVEAGEECDDGNTTAGDWCSPTCQLECNNNGICQPEIGENIGICPNDCTSGGGGGGGTGQGAICGLNGCESGETPASCPDDCSNSSMCYYNGEWDLCCLFGGDYCADQEGGATSGYYSVCNGLRCEERYLLEEPSFECASDAECIPNTGGEADEIMVSNDAGNWLRGLEPYLATIPVDPCSLGKCHKRHPTNSDLDDELNKYWCSSHPEVVGKHRFCCYASAENAQNVNPYNDITDYPTGGPGESLLWSVLCVQ